MEKKYRLRAGKFRVTVELLKTVLNLPKDWNILDIRREDFNSEFYIGVSGEGLPEVKENELIPEIVLTFKDKKIIEVSKI